MSIYFSTNPARWFETDGIYISEQDAPQNPRIIGSNIVKMVGEFPWGPMNEVIEVNEPNDIRKLIGNFSEPASYGGVRAILGKQFGPLRVVRVDGATSAKAVRVVRDSLDAEDMFSVTAKYKGVAGNEIQVLYTKVDANTFNLRVIWGARQDDYLNLPRALNAFAGISSDIVDFAWLDANLSGALEDSDVAAVALSGGSNGTVNDLSFTGDVSNVHGLRVLEDTSDGGFVVFAERTSADLISALRAHIAMKRCQGAAQASTSNAFSDNATAANAIADDRLSLALHRVRQRFSGVEYTVDLAPFVAAVWSQIPNHYSVADYDNAAQLREIVRLPDGVSINRPEWVRAQEVGGITLEKLDVGGYKFHSGLTSDPAKPSMVTRRMKDVVGATVGFALLPYQNKPPINIFVDAALASIGSALSLMQGIDDVPQSQQIEAHAEELLSRSGTAVIYNVQVKLWGEMRFIIANITVGEDIVITIE